MNESTHKSDPVDVGQGWESGNVNRQAGEQGKAQQQASKASETAEQAAAGLGGQAKEEFAKASEAVTREARKAAGSARRRSREFAQRQKMRLAGEIDACSHALGNAATRFNEESETNLGRYAGAAAEQLGRARSYLEERDLDEMLQDTEDVVRDHRELVFGACFAAGLGIARFLKSSGRRGRAQQLESEEERSASLKPYKQTRPPAPQHRPPHSPSRQVSPPTGPSTANRQ